MCACVWYLWNLSSFAERGGVEGSSPVLLIFLSRLCSSFLWNPSDRKGGRCRGLICSSLVAIIKEVQSATEGLSSLFKYFFFELIWRWMKHFLKGGGTLASSLCNTVSLSTKSLLSSDGLLVPGNGVSSLISSGSSYWKKTKQTKRISCNFCWNASILIVGLHLVWNSLLVRQDKQPYFLAKPLFDCATE